MTVTSDSGVQAAVAASRSAGSWPSNSVGALDDVVAGDAVGIGQHRDRARGRGARRATLSTRSRKPMSSTIAIFALQWPAR